MKALFVAMLSLVTASGAYATEGCPELTGAYQNCTIDGIAGNGGASAKFQIDQHINMQGQTEYLVHSEIQKPNMPLEVQDQTIAVSGSETKTETDGQGNVMTATMSIACLNQTLSVALDMTKNGASFMNVVLAYSKGNDNSLKFLTSITAEAGSHQVMLTCQKQ